MRFEKPALTIRQQIELLRKRGLIIKDEGEAQHYLRFIGYYRLSGYVLPLTLKQTDGSHNFKKGVEFADILNLYRFDRELRLIMIDAIERVEVAFRAVVSDCMAVKHGPHWFMKEEVFFVSDEWKELLQRIAIEVGFNSDGSRRDVKGKDVFIQHYYQKYTAPTLPPCWMVAEVLSISWWSKMFQNLKSREDKKAISGQFGLNPEVLGPWMHAISYTRNICAHHGRLWNREFTIKPLVAKGYEAHLSNNGRFYAQAFVLNYLLTKAAPQAKWWTRLNDHVFAHKFVDPKAMGFPSTGQK